MFWGWIFSICPSSLPPLPCSGLWESFLCGPHQLTSGFQLDLANERHSQEIKRGENEIQGLILLVPSHTVCDGPAGPLQHSPQLLSGSPLLAHKFRLLVLMSNPRLYHLGLRGVVSHWPNPSMPNVPTSFSLTLTASL